MRRILFGSRLATAAALLAVVGAGSLIQGCSTDSLLSATDPDLIVPGTLQSGQGAIAVYYGAINRLRTSTAATDPDLQEPAFLFSGLLADEWSTSSTFVQNDEVDQRSIKLDNSSVRNQFRQLSRVRTAADQAIDLLRKYQPADKVKLAEMYFARGFAELQLASDYCNGIPLSDGAANPVTFGTPLSVAEVFGKAGASFDSALALVPGTAAGEVDIARAARIGRARAYVGINNLPAAALLVTPALVPTTYSYDATMSLTGGSNAIWGQGASSRRYTVGDSLEGNARNLLIKGALPFFSSKDPRLPVSYTVSSKGDTTKSQDGFTFSRTTPLYGQLTAVPLASGLDARLIEAEARLQAGDYAGMMTILNALRAAPPKLGDIQPTAAQLPPLAVPTSKTAAEDLYFREKAFWVFGRGQRLNDLRRLMRFYGRSESTTFPTGTHYRGGSYGTDKNLPIPVDEQVNPNYKGCTDRNP